MLCCVVLFYVSLCVVLRWVALCCFVLYASGNVCMSTKLCSQKQTFYIARPKNNDVLNNAALSHVDDIHTHKGNL